MVLLQTQLFFRGSSDNDGTIEVELIDSEKYWVRRALSHKLRDTDMGQFLLDTPNLESNWTNPQWEEGQDNVYFPLVHYGDWIREQNFEEGHIAPEDFLPWISLLSACRLAMRDIGWGFDSPLFDVDEVKRWWVYILDENFDYDNKGQFYAVDIGMAANQIINSNSPPTDGLLMSSVFDDSASQVFLRDDIYAHDVTAVLNLTHLRSKWSVNFVGIIDNPNAFTIQFDIVVINNNTNNIISRINAIRIPPGGGNINVSMEYETDYGNDVHFGVTGFIGEVGTIFNFTFLSGFQCQIRAISNRLYRFDTIQINQLIGRDYVLMDLLKGFVHLIGGKIDTDWNTKTVWLYPPETTLFHGTEVEGFLLPTSQNLDVTNDIVPESRVIVTPRTENDRFLRLQFKKSTDEYITKRLLVDTDKQLYSRDVDLGRGVENKIKPLANPFFEPTGNFTWNRLEIPALWGPGGNDGERSSKVKPRIGYAVGYFAQLDGGTADSKIGWEFEWEAREELPILSQYPTKPYWDGGVVDPEVSIVFERPDGNEDLETLYSQIWKREVRIFISTVTYEFLIFANQSLFVNMDFRRRLYFIYGGAPYVLRLLEKRDYQSSRDIPFIILGRPGPKIME